MSWIGIVVIGLAGLMTALMLWTAVSAQKVRGLSVAGLVDVIPELDAHQARAVIYCYSEHCGPCRKLGPQIDRLRETHDNVFKLDITAHPRAARAIGIRATPTTLLVEDGKILKALLGAGVKPAIEVFLRISDT